MPNKTLSKIIEERRRGLKERVIKWLNTGEAREWPEVVEFIECENDQSQIQILEHIVEESCEKERRFVSQPVEYKGSDANVWREGYNQAIRDFSTPIKSELKKIKEKYEIKKLSKRSNR